MSRGAPAASSTASIAVDDRAYAAWSHLALDCEVTSASFGVKDVIDVAGMPTACGFEPWRERTAADDAVVVQRLRAVGRDPVGKTHTAQFAFSDPPPTVNPIDASLTPGGSSTGSAVAVRRGHVTMALATQTGGSTIRPAAYCGVVGMKPSFGVVPVEGIHPVAPSLDTLGIITDRVATMVDAAHDVGAIDGPGLRLARTPSLPASVRVLSDIGTLLQDAAAEEAWRRVADVLAAGVGAEPRPMPTVDLPQAVDLHVRVMAVEVWPFHERIFTSPESAYYGRKLRGLLERGRELSATSRIEDHLVPLRSVLADLARSVPDDGVLLMPATIGRPPERSQTGSSQLCMPWTVLGLPVVVVPWELRLDDGRTESGGVQVVGQHGADAEVLAAAAAVEAQLRTAGLGTEPADR